MQRSVMPPYIQFSSLFQRGPRSLYVLYPLSYIFLLIKINSQRGPGPLILFNVNKYIYFILFNVIKYISQRGPGPPEHVQRPGQRLQQADARLREQGG